MYRWKLKQAESRAKSGWVELRTIKARAKYSQICLCCSANCWITKHKIQLEPRQTRQANDVNQQELFRVGQVQLELSLLDIDAGAWSYWHYARCLPILSRSGPSHTVTQFGAHLYLCLVRCLVFGVWCRSAGLARARPALGAHFMFILFVVCLYFYSHFKAIFNGLLPQWVRETHSDRGNLFISFFRFFVFRFSFFIFLCFVFRLTFQTWLRLWGARNARENKVFRLKKR